MLIFTRKLILLGIWTIEIKKKLVVCFTAIATEFVERRESPYASVIKAIQSRIIRVLQRSVFPLSFVCGLLLLRSKTIKYNPVNVNQQSFTFFLLSKCNEIILYLRSFIYFFFLNRLKNVYVFKIAQKSVSHCWMIVFAVNSKSPSW